MAQRSAPMIIEDATRYAEIGNHDFMVGAFEIATANDLALEYTARTATLSKCVDATTNAAENFLAKASIVDVERW